MTRMEEMSVVLKSREMKRKCASSSFWQVEPKRSNNLLVVKL